MAGINFEQLYMRAINKYCYSASVSDCSLKALKKNSHLLKHDIVEIDNAKKTLKSVPEIIKKKPSEYSDEELEQYVDDFIQNIDKKTLKEIKEYTSEYHTRKIQPIRNAIIEKKRYMLEHECNSDLYDEINHLEEKYEIFRQKWLVLYNTQKDKEHKHAYNIYNYLSDGQKNLNVREIPNPRAYLEKEEYSILNTYFDQYPYNMALRVDKLNDVYKKDIEILDRAFEKAPALKEDAVVYRALSDYKGNDEAWKFINDFMNSIKEGNIVKDKAYMSTAIKPTSDIFQQFASPGINGDGALLRIKLPKGTKALIECDECLLPRNSKLKINKVQFIDDVKIVDAEYILP